MFILVFLYLYLCSTLWRQYRVWSAIGGGWGGFIGPLQAQATISDPCRQGHGAGHGRAYLMLLHSTHRIWQAMAYVRCPLGTFEPCSAIRSKGSVVEMCLRREGCFTAVTSASAAQRWIVCPCGELWVAKESQLAQTFKTRQSFKYMREIWDKCKAVIVSKIVG